MEKCFLKNGIKCYFYKCKKIMFLKTYFCFVFFPILKLFSLDCCQHILKSHGNIGKEGYFF